MPTEAPITTLLRNVQANLRDRKNHPDVEIFEGRVVVAPLVLPLYESAPYLVVTPGAAEGGNNEAEWHNLSVVVNVVGSLVNDAYNESLLFGTATIDALDTMAKVVRDALVRPNPYSAAPYLVAPYTVGGYFNAITCVHTSTGAYAPLPIPPDEDEDPDAEAPFFIYRPVSLLYHVQEV